MRSGLPFLLSFLLFWVALVGLVPAASGATVTLLADELPSPVVGSTAVHVDGKTYVFGGRNPDGTYSPDILRYDPASGDFVRVDRFPATPDTPTGGRYAGAAVVVGGDVYYFGGAVISPQDVNNDGTPDAVPKSTRDIFRFDPDTERVSDPLVDRLPEPAWGISGVAANGRAYLFGGFRFNLVEVLAQNPDGAKRLDTIVQFDPSGPLNGRATRLADKLPYPVQDAAAVMIGDRAYVMGGLSDHIPETNPCPTWQDYDDDAGDYVEHQTQICITDRIVAFDPNPNAPLVKGIVGTLPYRGQFLSAAGDGEKAYVPGALLSDGRTPANTIVEVTVVDRKAQTRIIEPTLPRATFGQAVVHDGEVIHIFGGRYADKADLTDEVVVLDPRPTVPWAPRSATALPIDGGVRLTWEPPTYDGDAPVTGYRVYRTPVGGDEEFLADSTLLRYDDTTVTPGEQYVYRITSVNQVGESETGATVSRAADATVPSPPLDIQAFPADEKVVVRWQPPTSDGGNAIAGYRIYRDGTRVASVSKDVFEYTDTSVQNDVAYAYTVRAYNSKGDGAESAIARAEPKPVPDAPNGVFASAVTGDDAPAQVALRWIQPPESINKYVVYRGASPSALEPVGEVAGSETSFTDTEVTVGATYYYAIRGTNAAGDSPPSTPVSVSLVRTPGAPEDVAAIGEEGRVRVTWQAPTDTGDAPAENLRYLVKRNGVGIATDLTGTQYLDRTVTPGQTYRYTVTTLNPQPSAASAEATATPMAVQNQAPTAKVAALPARTDANQPVELDGSQSSDRDGTIATYLFDPGDGSDPIQTHEPTLTHTYATNGTYTIRLTVTDDRGDTSEEATTRLLVGEPQAAENLDTGLGSLRPNDGSTPTSTREGGPTRPGETTPDIPGPGALAALAAIVAAALVARRHRRG